MTEPLHNLLEQHFDTAFAAPDGIKKLRELILTLAMQGKLVAQDPNDPPARELLKQIEAEKQQLVKSGKIKQPKPLSPIKPEGIPYEIPQGWEWVRLGDIGIWKSGSTPNRSNASFYGGNIPWIKSGEVKQGRIKTSEETITQAALDKCSLHINEKGSVLVAMYGANIGEVGILEIEAATNQAVCACRTFTNFDENYLLYLITSLKPYFLSQGAGAAQPNISREKIVATVFSLPPLPEQHRIVAKIDQLMAKCDELEKLRVEREQKRRVVHAAAIKQLLDTTSSFPRRRESSISKESDLRSPSAREQAYGGDGVSAHGWNFIQQHFGELCTAKENVAELRKAILQLAVMGRLVPQEPNDPPARELLKEIDNEKQRLVKAGTIKQPKPLPPIKPEGVPYELPQGWEWVRLGEAMLKITDGTHHSPINNEKGDFLYISAKNIKDDGVLLSNATYVTKEVHDEIFSRCDPGYGNILYIKDGATTGVATLNNLKEPFSMLSSVALLKQPQQINNRYILLTLRSPFFYEEMRAGMTGVAITRVTLKRLHDAIIPLPPLPEQHRIVAKIDQLMALCDRLEQQTDAATGKQTELLDAVMAEV